MKKKTIVTIVVVLAIGGVAWYGWKTFMKNKTKTTTAPASTPAASTSTGTV